MARIVVTGAAGYIGSAVARMLVDDGHHVIGVDKVASGLLCGRKSEAWLRDLVVREEGDSPYYGIDGAVLDEIVQAEPDMVVNLAACSSPSRYDTARPGEGEALNYGLPVELRDALPGALLVQAGTVMPGELHPYAEDKWTAEEELQDYHTTMVGAKSAPTVVLKLATVVGVSPKMRWDISAHAMALSTVRNKEVMYVPGLVRPFVALWRVVRVVQELARYGMGAGRGLRHRWVLPQYQEVTLCDAVLEFEYFVDLFRQMEAPGVLKAGVLREKPVSFAVVPTGGQHHVRSAVVVVVSRARDTVRKGGVE